VEKPERKRPSGRARSRRENNNVNLKEISWEGLDWIDLAQDLYLLIFFVI
jgi:hypothetical protein